MTITTTSLLGGHYFIRTDEVAGWHKITGYSEHPTNSGLDQIHAIDEEGFPVSYPLRDINWMMKSGGNGTCSQKERPLKEGWTRSN